MTRFLHSLFMDWTEGRRTPGLVCFGAFAKPLSWLYRAGAAVDGRLRLPRQLRLSGTGKLIVVSSPVVGGVGKTPIVAHLAAALLQRGFTTHVVTTGYKRTGVGMATIKPSDRAASAALCGDEAVMISQMTGATVHVGEDLTDVVARVAHDFHPDFIVVDDGVRRRWQGEHRIVVLTPDDLGRPVRFLPDGRWRIAPQRAWPASAVAIIGVAGAESLSSSGADRERHRKVLRSWGYDGPVSWYDSVPDGLVCVSDHAERPVESYPDGRPFVFCGVGSPSRFVRQIELIGLRPAGMQRFPDHHPYTAADLAELERQSIRAGAQWMLTTHKDAVKIDPAWLSRIPVWWLRIRLELTAGDNIDMLSAILETIQ